MRTLTLPAPAKFNLSLRVIGKREDGFHEIDTLMVKLPALADSVVFEEAANFSFQCDDSTLPTDESNLVVKAIRAYEEASGLSCKFRISLEKVIPHGAGLGGGSSDAATTLLGIDQLHGDQLGSKRLQEIATTLGSDIPFFMKPGAARCTGRGEDISSIPSPSQLRVLLLKPSFGVSTPDAYIRWGDSRELPGLPYAAQELDGVTLINDLERPVFEKHRFLAEMKQWLLMRDECTASLLAGSGSTLFAILHEGASPEELARAARHELDPGLWHWTGTTEG